VVQDITERQRFMETIQQMLNGSIAAICLLDSVRDALGNIVDFTFRAGNKAAERITEKSTKEIVGHRLLDIFPGVKEVLFNQYVQVVETGEPLQTELYYDHEHFKNWFEISAIKNGDGFIMTFYDITAQKNAEQKLMRKKML
jgi:PAS domain-containing protein